MLDFKNTEYYPTPEALAFKMAAKVKTDIFRRNTILEPSAGDGNLIEAFLAYKEIKIDFEVDFIEKEDSLRKLCKARFSEERLQKLRDESNEAEEALRRNFYDGHIDFETYENGMRKGKVFFRDSLNKATITSVDEDFLTFRTYKEYDCILMNPPFSNGDEHLLKALLMQKQAGGQIVAIVNAETIRNPFTNRRKTIVKLLSEADASLEYIKDAFTTADRPTDVEVCLIDVTFPRKEKKSLIFDYLESAKKIEEGSIQNALMRGIGTIEQLIEQYNFEMQASLKLVDEYMTLVTYMRSEFNYGDSEYYNKSPMLELLQDQRSVEKNKLAKSIRLKYWKALFHNKEFFSKLTSELYHEFMSCVKDMAVYEFNHFNINQVLKMAAGRMSTALNDNILKLFDKLSCVYSYSGEPEETNVHLFNGWRTNKSWKINDKRVILPCYHVFKDYPWDKSFNAYYAFDLLNDIQKVLDYLDNGETEEIPLKTVLNAYEGKDKVNNVSLKYFDVTFYKKGTCHIKWTNKRLVEKLNIYGSQKKAWLPPSYGHKRYEEMDDEERTVIDEFQGKEAYDNVLKESSYYLVGESCFLKLTAV